ncbi:MAG: phytoene/squalene synthase family protein [Gammaproteobacteria bacterium]
MNLDPDDLAHCRALLRGGSLSFHAASRLLPARVRDPATALYAFCRLADDAVDEGGDRSTLAVLDDRLARIYAGTPCDHPADRLFSAVVARYAIPRALPAALLEGFSWDLSGRPCDTLADLRAYAARVAGSVGVMMALLMGTREPWMLARASELGIAMQLSNIARDVGEDARAGRLYLPRSWLDAERVDVVRLLREPRHSDGLARVVARVLRVADALYTSADAGIARLPADCRAGIRAARLLYAEIGAEVARRDCDAVAGRAVVPRVRKAAVLARGLVGNMATAAVPAPLPEVRFLIDAVAATPAPPRSATSLERTLALFERLERRDRVLPRGGGATLLGQVQG